LKAVITFSTKSTKRERSNFQNKSKDSLLTGEEASSGSGGSLEDIIVSQTHYI